MNRKRKNNRVSNSLFSISKYIAFFLLTAFIVTCCMMLFLLNIDLSVETLKASAPRTFFNVLFLSLLFCVIDGIRRKLTVEKPLEEILKATDRITNGDFSARIEPTHKIGRKNEFDVIIENLNIMAEEISGTETLRTDFISNVSHELKTPLAVIQNYATMLQKPSLTEEERIDYAKAMSVASQKLSALITNILKLNKLENQQIFSDDKRYNLSEQLCRCLLDFENVWNSKSLEIETDIDEDVFINADEELLTLVWNNLFSNAIKFTDAYGKIFVKLKSNGEKCVVEVTDTGCGMSRETGVHIFEKFYQGDTSHSVQGNGLGLALVKRVVDIIGGEITVKSEVGKGSTFTIILRGENSEKISE
ncbi:MAG: HAMP domain-containing histidine kinase [Clostridium sp.]|nr:HAMP domain-containing histidine kinase [Clostridium sp.]